MTATIDHHADVRRAHYRRVVSPSRLRAVGVLDTICQQLARLLAALLPGYAWGHDHRVTAMGIQISSAYYHFGVREGKKIDWLVSLRDMLDDVEIAIQENLPYARQLVQGRRRIVASDRAAVFLCSRPIRSTEDYVPVVLRVFLKKYGVLPLYVVFLHVQQISRPYANLKSRYEVIRSDNIVSAVAITAWRNRPFATHACWRRIDRNRRGPGYWWEKKM